MDISSYDIHHYGHWWYALVTDVADAVEVVQADERVNPDFLGHLVAISSQTRRCEMNCFYQVGLQQRLKDHSYLYDKDQFACLQIHADCQWESEEHLSAPLKPA